jgi:hypothetical protein
MTDTSATSQPPPDRRRRPGRRGIVHAVLIYLGIVYVVWVCFYAVGDIKAGDFHAGVIIAGLYTTLAALILVGIPTVIGTVIVLLLRPKLRPVWLGLLLMLIAFGPSLYWWMRPSSDHEALLIQQIPQTLFLAYLLLKLRRT